MFKNYLKTAWRNLVHNKGFAFINMAGLALGLAASLLITVWVVDERSIDGFHENGDRLFQVYERNFYDNKVDANYATQGLLAQELKAKVPEIEYVSGFEYSAQPGTQNTVAVDDKVSKMTGMFAGEDFFKMFSYRMLQGNAANALNKPSSVAVSKTMADYFFGSAQAAVGKTILFENKENLLVTAVFEDVPTNSSLRFDFLRNWSDFVQQNKWVNNWGNTSPSTFVQLRKGADASAVESKIKSFVSNYQAKVEGFKMELALQPFAERYLFSNFKNGYIDGGRIEYVRLFTIIAAFIVLIACINFMNLATARASKRSKEVGVRKVVGALRSTLFGQFIGEALLITFFAVVIALVVAALMLPFFNSFTGKVLALPLSNPLFWAAITALIIITGIVAGSYPAVFLSSLKPIRILKGHTKSSNAPGAVRKGLVVFQFSLSIILIVGMITIYRQMDYIQNKNLGYNRENLIYVPIEGDLIKNYTVFKERLQNSAGISSVSKMRNSPTVIEHHTGSIDWPGKQANLAVSFADGVVGYDYVKTMKLSLKEGRDFSKEFADSTSYIINETAAQKMGFKEPLGQTVSWGNRKGKIIGVLKDFHFSSMHKAIEPLILRLDENWSYGNILVRTEAGKTKQALASLEKIYKELNPTYPITYQFSDIHFQYLYSGEVVVSKLSACFAFLAIFISCLGLFGLAAFSAEQRTKEIGVRKVLGASAANIARLLSTNFLQPILIAFLIAVPVAWYMMHNWLQNYAYKIDMEWWVFALAALITLCIAFITVSYQSIKAALVNPVKSLKTE